MPPDRKTNPKMHPFVEPGNNDEIDKSGEATVLEETTEIGIFPPVADIKPSQAGEKEPDTGFDFSSLDLVKQMQ